MTLNDFICHWNKISGFAIMTFDLWLPANALYPFFATAGLITAFSGFGALKSLGENIFPTPEKRSKNTDLLFFRREVCH
jgi:hypothetical protein